MRLARFLFRVFKPSNEGLKEEVPVFLLVGLGNPGEKYKKNRHNIGFMVVDAIGSSYGFPTFKSKFLGQYSEGRIGNHKVGIIKPSTYMNESGQSVGAVAKFYKLLPDQIIVFHDELDLAPAKIKIKVGGGHAGHNGLRSLDVHLGDKNYKRVRIGIGHPGDKNKVSGYVLSDFAKADQKWVDDVLYGMGKYGELLLENKDNDFMTNMASL